MKRSKHSLSHYKLLSGNMGNLIPIACIPVLPGDTFQHSTSLLLRCSPLVAPVMHPVHVKIHHWFVPNRIIWEDWENFITGGPDGTSAPSFPVITSPATTGWDVGSLADYLGIPPGVASTEFNALPFRAYAKIFNEWYRDEDLINEQGCAITSGADSTTNTTLLNRCWEKDYFTTSRTSKQKGTAVNLDINGFAPVIGTTTGPNLDPIGLMQTANGYTGTLRSRTIDTTGGFLNASNQSTAWVDNSTIAINSAASGLQANLTGGAGYVSIDDLREAIQLQGYKEDMLRYGSRYTEYLRQMGVKSSDARLQRPEYLGGGKQTIQFSEVLATAETEVDSTTTNVGAMKGHGIAAMRSNRYRRFFEEHGYVISLMSVVPKTVYVQSCQREFFKRTKEDFFQKQLQHIGQQTVLAAEVWAKIAESNPDASFGFQDRYDEYRRHESSVSGEFRTTLNYWHMGRSFSTIPVLNNDFVYSNPTDRIFADTTSDQLLIMANHNIQARRLVDKTGRPSTLF